MRETALFGVTASPRQRDSQKYKLFPGGTLYSFLICVSIIFVAFKYSRMPQKGLKKPTWLYSTATSFQEKMYTVYRATIHHS